MREEDILNIKVDTVNEEEARILATDILEGDIDKNKAAIKRGSIISAILSLGLLLTTKNHPILSTALIGLDAVTIVNTLKHLFDKYSNQRKLEKFNNNTYNGSYADFIKDCQYYIKAMASKVDTVVPIR